MQRLSWLSRLASAVLFGVLGYGATILLAQNADRFEISGPPAQVIEGEPFILTIRAMRSDGSAVTNWQGELRLLAFSPTTSPPVISEIDRTGDAIEIINPGDLPVSIGDWELQVLPDYSDHPAADLPRLRLPHETTLPPRGVITWSSHGVPPGGFPVFVSGQPLSAPGNPFQLIRLYDANGNIVDEVYLRSFVFPPPDAVWHSPGLSSYPINVSHTRVGDANHFRNTDWTTNTSTLGAVNPGLRLPWSNAGHWKDASPARVPMSNGVWTGSVALTQTAAGTASLFADNGAGVSGWSARFEVVSLPLLNLVLSAGLQPASEAQPGLAGQVTLSIPAALTNNLTINLALSDTNEFQMPTQAVIVAGTTSVSIAVTNYDDLLADGLAVVTLAARAPGYAPATAMLLNDDNEVGRLFVNLPSSLKENSGFAIEPGRVFLDHPARHDVLVLLSAEPPIEVPESVIIPAGRLSQTFWLRIGDDLLANPVPWERRVWAETAGWPATEGVVRLVDDEDPGFEVEMPGEVVEGIPATGLIRFRTRHAADTAFELTSNNARLEVPPRVTVSAGQLEAAFSLQVPENTQTNNLEGGTICVHSAGLTSICRQVILADDEVDIDHLIFGWPPAAVLSGQRFPMQAVLVNFANQPQQISVPGQLELLVAPALAQLLPGSDPIQITSGRWSNTVVVLGEALDAELQFSAAGQTTQSRRFDVLAGREVTLDFTDAVWHGASGKFLVAERVQANLPARLTEIDPRTGERARSLALPRGVRRIALSDDGRVAWLASMQGTLQRVDLATWRFDREFPLNPVSANVAAWDLVLLPQQSERLVAAVDGAGGVGTTDLALFDQGTNLPLRASLPGSRWSLALMAGRTTNEVFCQSFGNLSRFNVVTNGVTLDRSVGVNSSSTERPSLSRNGDRLYRGYGDVYSAETLERLEPFPTVGSRLACPVAERGMVIFLEQNGSLKAFGTDDRQALGSHSIPESSDWPVRLLRWGERGLAYFKADGEELTIIETPLLNSALPDLELTVQAPPIVEFQMTNGSYIPTMFNWLFAITNRGSATAFGAKLELDTGEWFELGTLAPGQGLVIKRERPFFTAGVFRTHGTVTSVTSDANRANNEAEAVTLGKTPDLPSSRQLILGMTHLIGSPSGTRLYASLAHSAGAVNEGVAVVDPQAGSIEKILPIGPNPQRLAISGDGSRLYALLGTNTLARWNLAAASNELVLTFTNETLLDFITLPDAPQSVIVATTARVAVLEDAQFRPVAFNSPMDRRHLGFAGTTLWVAEPGRLRPFTLTASGLSGGTSVPFALSNAYYGFASDGRYLYFNGAIFDTVTRQKLATIIPGNYFLADTNSESVFATWLDTSTGSTLNRYSSQTLSLLGTQPLPQALEHLMDPVRWGHDGLAVRTTRNQLLMVHSPLVPTNVVNDLAVLVTPPVEPVAYQPLEWTIVLTNRSAQAALRTLLTVTIDGDLQDVQVEGPAFQQFYSSFYFELGDMAANSSSTIRVRGWARQQNLTVSASVVSAALDPTPEDHSASATVRADFRVADLGIHSVIVPDRVRPNEPFDCIYVVTNAGPDVVSPWTVWLLPNPTLEVLGISCLDCPTNADGTLTFGDLAPGDSKQVIMHMRVTEPGLVALTAYPAAPISNPRPENNRGSRLIYVVPAATNQVVTELHSIARPTILSWNPSRQQVLAAFPDDFSSLFVLSPQTLEPLIEIPLGGSPQLIAPCDNGLHVWVSLAEGEAARVDLMSNAVDLRFQYEAEPSSAWFIATPPGKPDILLAALASGNTQVRVYDRGVARPGAFGPLGWPGGGVPMLFTPDGRLFLAASQLLRELQLVPTGVQEVRNLDHASGYSDLSLSYANNRLYLGSDGRIVALDTGTADDTLRPTSPLVADVETSQAYTASGSRIIWGGPPMIIRAMDATTLASTWRLELPLPHSGAGGIVPMGTNGLVVVGDKLRLVRTALFGTQQTDLALNLSLPAVVGGVQVDFPVQIAVTNRAVWTASETKVIVQLTPGLVFAAGNPGAGSNFVELALGSLNGGTNFSLYARATTDGVHAIHASVASALPETAVADNEQQAMTTVLPAPILFFDDTSVREGSSSRPGTLVATLSRPAPADLSVGFTIVPLTAQAGDFSILTGAWQFRAGESTARVFAIQGDSGPELDENAMLTISSDQVTPARTSAVVTIANDDWPQITVMNVAVDEGNSGITNAVFRAALAPKAPFPVDVRFETVGGTASANLDFLPREGWLRFGPNEDVKLVSVPVLGDTIYEPAESAAFSLLNAVNAEFGVSQGILTIRNDDLPPAPIAAIGTVDAAGFQIVFQTVAGATYQLQVKTNLTTDVWRTLPASMLGTGQPSTFTLDAQSAPESYFRVFAR